jgi:hypothetical protein
MLDKTQDMIDKIEREIIQLENLMQEALNEGDDVSGYARAISKLETRIWKLETSQ